MRTFGAFFAVLVACGSWFDVMVRARPEANAATTRTANPQPPAPGKQLPSSYLPAKLRLVMSGGIVGPSCSVQLEGETLIYTASGFDESSGKPQRTNKTIKPTAHQWEQFWRTMNEVDVWKWRPNYPNRAVADGTQWWIEVEYGGNRIKSSGSNNYPGIKPGQPIDVPSALFERYLAAVSDLLGGERFE